MNEITSQTTNRNHFLQGNTALHFASKYGFMDMVVYLVEQGSEINFKNDRGRTSLIWACMYE